MNRQRIGVVVVGLVVALASTHAQQAASPLKTDKAQRSYALGMDLGNQFRKMALDVDPAVFSKGLTDALAGGKTLMTEDEVKAAISKMQSDLKARTFALATGSADPKAAEDNLRVGVAFLASNKVKPGVVTLPSGVQYKVLTAGTGKKPLLASTVVCNYRGTLIDGTEFDSSYARKQPATFQVNGVIPGWKEALLLMPAGSKWQVVVPANLAYGARGSGPKIGPNSTLVFEIELVAVK